MQIGSRLSISAIAAQLTAILMPVQIDRLTADGGTVIVRNLP
jgi:hypothetical protein